MSRAAAGGSGGAQIDNKSIGLTGNTAPTSATEIGAVDSSGNLQALTIDGTGALVVTSSPAVVTTVVNNYNEITSIASGVETTIVTYTAPAGKQSFLQIIAASGDNKAIYTVYQNLTVFDKKYIYYPQLTADFDYRSGNSTAPGILIPVATVIKITAIHNRPYVGTFNARIQVIEYG